MEVTHLRMNGGLECALKKSAKKHQITRMRDQDIYLARLVIFSQSEGRKRSGAGRAI